MPTGLTSCLQLVDLDIFSGLARAKATAAEGSRELVWEPGRESRACHCKDDKC